MKKVIKMKSVISFYSGVIISLTLSLFHLSVFAQNDSFSVNKIYCCHNRKETNGQLIIKIYTKDSVLVLDKDYNFFKCPYLSFNTKLAIIKQLLSFKKDRTVCCKRVTGYLRWFAEYCPGSYKSKTYPIAVEALFIINRLYFNDSTFKIEDYSCSPVLYDTLTKKEINWDFKKIDLVYHEYELWFNKVINGNSSLMIFPFNNGRYVWFGGKRSDSEGHPINLPKSYY